MIEVAQAGLIAAGLVLPGWGWARRWNEGLVIAMVVAWLSLFGWTVFATLAGIPLHWAYLAFGQILTGLAGWWWARQAGVQKWGIEWDLELGVGWLVLPMVAVAAWKAIAQPLSGVDVDFRWNHLAEMMVQQGGLQFYPPTTAEDFAVYFWADGIPPLISSLYAWCYLIAGESERVWTAIPVLLQWSALLMLLKKLGGLVGGKPGGGWALLVGGSTFLLQFAFNLGQETGCTALGVGVMLYGFGRTKKKLDGNRTWLVGIGATLVAASREYGWAIAVAGLVAHVHLIWRKGSGWNELKGWLVLGIPAVWYLRTWVISGNPWLSLSMGGMFPVNPIFEEWLAGYRGLYGESIQTVAGWREVGRLGLLTAAPALAGWVAGMVLLRRQRGWSMGMALGATTVFCWLLSVPYTAGGVFYSMRVLSPLLVLGSAWGGAILATRLESRPLRVAVAGLLSLWTLDASARALTASANPWTTSAGDWSTVGYQWQQEFWVEQEQFFNVVMDSVPGRFVGDASGAQRFFARRGRDYVPWWSPEVREMFEPADDGDAIDLLRSRGIRHLVFHRVDFSQQFLERTGVLAQLDGRIRGVMANDNLVVFELLPANQ